MNLISNGLFLFFIVGIPLIAYMGKVDIFAAFTTGAKEGFELAIKLIPTLVGMLVAIGMFRAAGGFTLIANWIGPSLQLIGVPKELLPLALTRPFSGAAANAVFMDIAKQHGGNSHISHLAAIMMGSTETTFYVIAVYFGAVAITKTRYAIPIGLFADFIGFFAAVVINSLI